MVFDRKRRAPVKASSEKKKRRKGRECQEKEKRKREYEHDEAAKFAIISGLASIPQPVFQRSDVSGKPVSVKGPWP
jgi:hypothetical protein